MREFLNRLNDSVLVIDEQRQIIFMNTVLLNLLGYLDECIDMRDVKEKIRLIGSEVHVGTSSFGRLVGDCKLSKVDWEGQEAYIGIIEWRTKTQQSYHLLEQALDHIGRWVTIKDRNGKYIWVNELCSKYYGLTRDRKSVV